MTQMFGHLVLAFWLLATAPKIARFIYPESSPRDGDSTKTPPLDTPTT
jgi:hypothetical protein